MLDPNRCKATVPQRWHTAAHQCSFAPLLDGLCGKHLRQEARAREQRAKLKCHWSRDGGDDLWATGCGNAFQFNDGTPKENSFRWCPYCGKALEQGRR